MANPRKFSEKIALHHQKQAEETAAFEQIMREVSDATSKPEDGVLGQFIVTASSSPQPQSVPTPQPQTRGRPPGVGPMRARPQDRKIDTSPYSSTVYLSPPPDSSWRRTNSDSALHQSSALPRDISPQRGSPRHHHHHHHATNHHHHHQTSPHHFYGQSSPDASGGQLNQQLQQHTYSHSHHSINTTTLHHSPLPHRRDTNDGVMTMIESNPNRPRSSCEVPRVPGIHICLSPHDTSGNQIPIGSGSLPDLTSVHFPTPPIHAASPLERDMQDHSSSPYSTSPVSASPATLSPTSVPPLRSTHSPHHSPHSTPKPGSPTAPLHYTNHQTPQNHLSVPNSNRYSHHSKSVPVENWTQVSYQQQCSPPSLHSSHSNINVHSPTIGVAPAQISSNGGYRSPRSPSSSPGGAGGGGDSPHYDGGGATYSSQSAADHYFISHALQQHFEQFSMMDNPVTSLSYMNNVNTSQNHYTQATLPGNDGGGGGTVAWPDSSTCSGAPACIQAGSCLGGASCIPGPHPNTPTTIPDIILTDFSSTNPSGDLTKDLSNSLSSQFSKDLSANLSSHFDTSLFPEDESLRDGLDPIDFDGLQMLTDPDMNVISDPTTEDAFRLDRL